MCIVMGPRFGFAEVMGMRFVWDFATVNANERPKRDGKKWADEGGSSPEAALSLD
jgi:hypothetical protein